uniref:Integrase catalytic domain-containing protein n=1 Tax=Rhizophagus irregularis (strain DAOM 181602 / DAOM 197198 / MUCL 43194) TaxID=747089 RepID=U9TY45_RHIID
MVIVSSLVNFIRNSKLLSSETRKPDFSIALQKIYYQPIGYQRNAKKLFEASLKAGYDFTLDEVKDWLERQAVYRIHKSHPKYIPRASFCSITTPNKVHQADVLYMPYDKVGRVTYLFCLNVVDVASRYKASVPIGAYSVKDREGILTSKTIARAIEKIYDDPECPLVWPKTFLTDRGPEFRGDCEKLMREHDVKIQKAKSKRTMGIFERYNRTLIEKLFPSQDASDLLTLHLNKISRLGISPVDAIEKEEVFAKPSYPRDGPIGFDEEKLSDDVLVRYLLYPSDLEGGRHRAGDLNWSPHIYHICQSMVQKNQPVLYWLEEVPFELIDNDDYILKRPERSFVREELMVIPFDTELPPQWVLTN